MAMYEQQKQVNVEFLKSSQGFMKGRVIKLSHGHQLPPQLIGRVDPVSSLVSVPLCCKHCADVC